MVVTNSGDPTPASSSTEPPEFTFARKILTAVKAKLYAQDGSTDDDFGCDKHVTFINKVLDRALGDVRESAIPRMQEPITYDEMHAFLDSLKTDKIIPGTVAAAWQTTLFDWELEDGFNEIQIALRNKEQDSFSARRGGGAYSSH